MNDLAGHPAIKAEQEGRMPFIAPKQFWIDYEPQPDGSMKPVEMLEWVKKGVQNSSGVVEKCSRFFKPSKAGQMTPEAQVIKPYYDNWRAGMDAPVNGTPLAAWPGATPQLVKALEPANIKSVEDLAEMEDSAIQRIAIPRLREFQKQARSFLEAQKSTAGVAGELAVLREKLADRDREVTELRELIEKHVIKQEQEDAPKRGRPRKVEAA